MPEVTLATLISGICFAYSKNHCIWIYYRQFCEKKQPDNSLKQAKLEVSLAKLLLKGAIPKLVLQSSIHKNIFILVSNLSEKGY